MRFNNLSVKELLEIAGVDTTKGKAKQLIEDLDIDPDAPIQELNAELLELKKELMACSDQEIRDQIEQDIFELKELIKNKR